VKYRESYSKTGVLKDPTGFSLWYFRSFGVKTLDTVVIISSTFDVQSSEELKTRFAARNAGEGVDFTDLMKRARLHFSSTSSAALPVKTESFLFTLLFAHHRMRGAPKDD